LIASRLTPVRPGNRSHFGFAASLLLVALSLAACGADEETLASEPPVVAFEVELSEDPLVRLDARGSTDPDGFIVSWLYEYGDGSPIEYSASPQAIHVYDVNGVYTVAVTATDDSGTRSTTTASVTIRNATGPIPPVDDADGGTTDAGSGGGGSDSGAIDAGSPGGGGTDSGVIDAGTGGGGADSSSTDLDGGAPDNGSGEGFPFPGEDAGAAPDSFGGADTSEDPTPDAGSAP
jgi:hypothetical protein